MRAEGLGIEGWGPRKTKTLNFEHCSITHFMIVNSLLLFIMIVIFRMLNIEIKLNYSRDNLADFESTTLFMSFVTLSKSII